MLGDNWNNIIMENYIHHGHWVEKKLDFSKQQ